MIWYYLRTTRILIYVHMHFGLLASLFGKFQSNTANRFKLVQKGPVCSFMFLSFYLKNNNYTLILGTTASKLVMVK